MSEVDYFCLLASGARTTHIYELIEAILCSCLALFCTEPTFATITPIISRAPVSTARRNRRFQVDVSNVIARSDIILSAPNTEANEAMPLGNGRLGVSVWAAKGRTAQLNRTDTLPYRYSPGQVVVPGLSVLTAASNFFFSMGAP